MFPYDGITIPALSPEEMRDPFAAFYSVPPARPPEEVTIHFLPERAMDSALSIAPEEIETLFRPGGLPQQNGYCIREDGIGYAAACITLPGFTDELSAQWPAWFSVNDVHYKIWLPGYHISHQNGITEDLGWGTLKIQRDYRTPHEELGLSAPAKELDSSFISFSSMSGTAGMLDGRGEPLYNTLVKCLKRRGEDIEEQMVVWFGVHMDGRRILPKPCPFSLEQVRLFGCHMAWETQRKASLWPAIHAYGVEQGLLPA